ncbi:5-formyltetrahydrofolate cyclo-ligase [Peptacetobacter hiranonis]|uniref:5-formyltetrahydrofolate cyclo-ligase n=1 Tax=Peptacetobacter hiranonis TaxID=89152 RepID=UPI001916CBC1|nr:5-formyltetrahydrofolate cyclo-ligase [Peptacetobacter hiranonis]QQQ86784.1 5-formyltetrahydrofolate cyclo-ligase [Peptacetobacter hiranonis]
MKYFYFRKDVNIISSLDLINSIKTAKTKNSLRKAVLSFRNSLDKSSVLSMSADIFRQFLSIEKIQTSSRFMLYVDFRNEVATREIISDLLDLGKEVYLPVTLKYEKKLIPKRIFSLDDLVFGAYGILEPRIDAPTIDNSLLDVVIVPGSVFDKNGYRTGYGGGYYDRFLESTDALKVGVCFDFQLVDDVFPEEHDKKMDFIITEKNFLNF